MNSNIRKAPWNVTKLEIKPQSVDNDSVILTYGNDQITDYPRERINEYETLAVN